MSNPVLSWLAAMSLLPTAVLLCGYVVVAGPRLIRIQKTPVAQLRSTSVELDRGRVRIWLATQTPPPQGAVAGLTVAWGSRLSAPDWKRCFWAFDNHSLTTVMSIKGSTAYIIAFPIWCLLLPCLVAPVLWLVRRRRFDTQVGFPIDVVPRIDIPV